MKMFEGTPITPPTILDAEIPLSLAGDRLRQTLCIFADNHGGEYALRPDMTLPIAMEIVAGRQAMDTQYCYDDVTFKLPQKRAATKSPIEQRHIGFEWYGLPSDIDTDVSALVKILRAAKDLGAVQPQVRIGDLSLLPAILSSIDIDPIRQKGLIDAYARDTKMDPLLRQAPDRPLALAEATAKLPKATQEGFLSEVFTVSNIRQQGERPIEDIADGLSALVLLEGAKPIDAAQISLIQSLLTFSQPLSNAKPELETLLDAYGVALRPDLSSGFNTLSKKLGEEGLGHAQFDINFPRRFTYYDGFCFQILSEDGATIIGAGGRYDLLLGRLSGGKMHAKAIGATLYPDRISGFGQLEAGSQ